MKSKVSFVCQECGYDTTSWLGKCPECGAWNSLKEFHVNKSLAKTTVGGAMSFASDSPQALSKIVSKETLRIQTKFNELNNVLGGGIVRGSATLIAGDPGIGKSTLLLELALSLAEDGKKVLYVSGEESVEQIKMRAERIGIENQELRSKNQGENRSSPLSQGGEHLFLVSMTNTDVIVETIAQMHPDFVVIDSIQTVESENVSGLSGSVAQVRYSALQFIRCAKQYAIPVFLVGHVTKEGMVAGPMVLSHMVDTVLFLEGEKFTRTRILRSLKNRFGPVDEVGIFLMEESGMVEVSSPEQLFLTASSETGANSDTPGSVLVATLEGSRAFLVEMQALVVFSRLPMPRRVVSGCDPRRVELLLAVLQKHCHLPVETMDVFVNVAGGLKLADPGIDLAICLAVYSSLKNKAMNRTVAIAEVGLLGELRPVSGLDKRIRESEKLGFTSILTAKTYKTLKQVIGGIEK